MMRSGDFSELVGFVAVGQELSFRRAAMRMGVSPSALSHTIRRLEERLGVRLLNRTTRSVALTEAGLSLFARLVPVFAELDAAEESATLFREQLVGTVRVNVPSLAAYLLFGEGLGRFTREFPGVHLEITVEDGFTDVVAAGFDAGIRLGETVHRDMIAVRVTPDLRVAVVGSPAYFTSRGVPVTPEDLHQHDCLNYRWSVSGAVYRWKFAKDEQVKEIEVKGPLTMNDTSLMVAAALEGAGLVCLLEGRVREHLESGRLVRVLEDWCAPFPGFFLYYPSRRQMPQALRALIAYLQRDKA
jgi:DNA-binding transcriptional LysR family regulator